MIVHVARWLTIPLALVWLALVVECVRYMLAHRPKPFDWAKECPELRDQQHIHVRVIHLNRWS